MPLISIATGASTASARSIARRAAIGEMFAKRKRARAVRAGHQDAAAARLPGQPGEGFAGDRVQPRAIEAKAMCFMRGVQKSWMCCATMPTGSGSSARLRAIWLAM
jgi:hypothetical protein